MSKDYYRYKKYKHLYKKSRQLGSGIDHLPEITINIYDPGGKAFPVLVTSPYTVENLIDNFPSHRSQRFSLFRPGVEEALANDTVLNDDETLFMVAKPEVSPIMTRDALKVLVDDWCRDEFTDDLLETYGHISDWDVGNVNTMSLIFRNKHEFNDNINAWDVGNVIDLAFMFKGARSFNQPLDNWNVSNVKNMGFMFQDASNFNQPLDNWDVGNVNNMSLMFKGASSFDHNNAPWYDF